jgi:hypothetical protein
MTYFHEQNFIQAVLYCIRLNLRPNLQLLVGLLLVAWLLEQLCIFHRSGDIFARISILQHTHSNDSKK